MSFVFGHPTYSYPSPHTAAYASPYGRSYYEDNSGAYPSALAAEREQRARDEYLRAALREREARRQEQEYRRALALEQQRHEAALREIAQRDALRPLQRQRPAAPFGSLGYPPERPSHFPQPSYQYTSSPDGPAFAPRGTRIPIIDSDAPFVEEPQPIPRRKLARNPHRGSFYDASPNPYLSQSSDEDLGRKLVLHLDKAPTPEQIKQVKDILSGGPQPTPLSRSRPTPHQASPSSTEPEPQEQSSSPEAVKSEVEKDEAEEPTVDIPETSSNAASPALAFSAISSIEHDFRSIKGAFTFPETLDFTTPASPGDTPRLTFSSINLPLRVHEQQLTNLLTKLDEIDSGGLQSVRDARKKLVNDIEAELEEMDQKKVEAGKRFVRSQMSTAAGEPVAEVEAETGVIAQPIADGPAEDTVMEPAELPIFTHPETTMPTSKDTVVDDHEGPLAEASTEPWTPEVVLAPEPVVENGEPMDVSQSRAPAPPTELSLPTTPLQVADAALPTDDSDDQAEDLEQVEQELASDLSDSPYHDDAVVLTMDRNGNLEVEEADRSDHGSDYEML